MTPGTPGLVTRCICKDSRKQEESIGRPGVPGWAVTFAMTEHCGRRSQVRGLVGKFNQWVIYRSVSGV